MKYAGCMKDADINWEEVKDNIRGLREEFDEEMGKRMSDRDMM